MITFIEDTIQGDPSHTKQLDVTFSPSEQSTQEMIGYTVICLGSSLSQCFKLNVDFSTAATILVDYGNANIKKKNKFESTKSKTFEMKRKNFVWSYNNRTMKGYQGTDQLTFGHLNESKDMNLLFNVVISETNPHRDKIIDGLLGLGNAQSDQEKNSNQMLMQQLYDQSLIKSKIFYIEHIDKSKALLNIGCIPERVYADYTHYGSCKVVLPIHQAYSSWQCSIKEVAYNPRFVDYGNEKAIFAYNRRYITPPYDLIDSIWNMFSDQQYTAICSKYTLNNRNVYIKCTKESSNYFAISITIGDWKIKIPIDEMINDKDNEERDGEGDGVVFYFEAGNFDWILGYNYLKLLTVVFDNEREMVNFYHPKWVEYIGREKLLRPGGLLKEDKETENTDLYHIKLILIIVLISISLFGIGLKIILHLKRIE